MADNCVEHNIDVRDLRIDFFRGLALYMILVDHVIADPIRKFTYHQFGFSDAAEIFVFVSGVSCGIAYSRVLVRSGWTGLMAKIARRTALIYGYYVLSSIAVILLLKAVAGSIKNAGVIDQSLIVLREDPFSAIWSAIFLISPPDLPAILVLYLVLTLIVIPLFLMGTRRSAALTFAVSGFIWTISQFYPNLTLNHSLFNPLAWQFLFSIGMFLGIRYNLDWSRLRSTQIFKWSLVAAWAIVLGSLLYRFSVFFSSRFDLDLGLFRISDITYVHMKENLSAVRLLHFLSVALLVATYVTSSNPILRWSGAVVVSRTGRCSLEIYSLCTILSVGLSIIFVVNQPSVLEKLVLDGIAILLIALTAVALTEFRRRHQRAIGDVAPLIDPGRIGSARGTPKSRSSQF
jgi:hypothetical protein